MVRARASHVGVTCLAVRVMKMSEITGERERGKRRQRQRKCMRTENGGLWKPTTWKGLGGKVNKMVEVVAAIQSEFK